MAEQKPLAKNAIKENETRTPAQRNSN